MLMKFEAAEGFHLYPLIMNTDVYDRAGRRLPESMLAMDKDQRPRERLAARGVASLSDTELITVIVGSGVKDNRVQDIGSQLLSLLDRKRNEVSLPDLLSIRGLGTVKAGQIMAAFEFVRRKLAPAKLRISFPGDILPFVLQYADRRQEYFLCASLNGAHEVTAVRIVTIGLINRTIIHPREVYADPLIDRAAAVIVAHNHPSGNVEPSGEDREVTARLSAAGETLGIDLLDHIIFSQVAYYSFLEHGEL